MTHYFDEFELRPAGEPDLALATRWTEADPDHAGMDPRFWIQQGHRMESWLLTDGAGPVFFFKAVTRESAEGKVLEVHVQFVPAPDERAAREHRARVARALVRGTAWLEKSIRDYDELRFESLNPRLIRFCERHLGFSAEAGKLCKRLRPRLSQAG